MCLPLTKALTSCSLIAALLGTLLAATAAAGQAPTYYKHIAPILETHCVTCHRPGQVAPMSLMSYEQVRPWAKAIATQVAKRAMPPFHAEGPIGRFRNDLRLTADQIETITVWAEQRARRGDPSDFEGTREWTSETWPAGEPDLIVRFPRVELKPDGLDPYVYLFSDYTSNEDLWVRGYDWHFQNTKFVHHVAAMQLPPGVLPPAKMSADGLTSFFPKIEFGSAGALFLPGLGPHFFPEGSTIKLPKNANVYGLFHYAPTFDEGEWDQPELGFYFADGKALQLFHAVLLQATDIRIPPGKADYTQVHRVSFLEDGYVWDFNIHMHSRGRSATINFHYPDGRTEEVFSMPRFSFDWQRRYYLREAIFAPKGTEAEFILVWDNSTDNPLNPDPTQEVTVGPFTDDEMGGARITYVPAEPVFGLKTIVNGRLAPSGLQELVQGVQAMTWEEVQAFMDTLEPGRRENIRGVWERKHGPALSN